MSISDKIWEFLRAEDVDGLRSCVRREGNAVTDTLVEALHQDTDPQIKGMAVDALGLTSDPRALDVLIAFFESCTGGIRNIASLAIANIAANRVKDPKAIPTLVLVAKDKSLDAPIRMQAILALIYFRKNDLKAAAALKAISQDPEVSTELRFLAS